MQQAIIDPEGDFGSFAERYGHVVVDAARSAGELQRIAQRIRQHRASVILDLEGLDADDQMLCAASFLNGLFDADRDHWYPMLIAVDEAQLFAPAVGGEMSDEARRASLGAMTNLMCRGRKRGLAGIIATQRLAKLAKNVAAEASNFLMGRTFLDIDMARAADLLGLERRQAEAFRDLASGQFVALGPALTRRPMEVRIGTVETKSRAGRPSLMPLPEAGGEALTELIFEPSDEDALPAPQPVRKAVDPEIVRRITTQQPQLLMVDTSEPDERTEEEKEAEIEAIFAEILADPEAAYRPIPLIYQEFAYHCRVKRLDDRGSDMPAFRRRLAIARAGLTTTTEDPDWARVFEISESLPEEMQGAYLLVVARGSRWRHLPGRCDACAGLWLAFALARPLAPLLHGGTRLHRLRHGFPRHADGQDRRRQLADSAEQPQGRRALEAADATQQAASPVTPGAVTRVIQSNFSERWGAGQAASGGARAA